MAPIVESYIDAAKIRAFWSAVSKARTVALFSHVNPDGDACAIGSGGNYALAAARALLQETDLSAAEIAKKALLIASQLCVFTNDNIVVEEV